MASLIQRARRYVSLGGWLPVLRTMPSRRWCVGITIDDGPTPETTPRLLDILRRHRASATFFVSGPRVAAAPLLVAEIVRAGHGVFAHGCEHLNYSGFSAAAIIEQMTRGERQLLVHRPTPTPYLVRLPYGVGRRDARIHRALRAWDATAQIAHWRLSLEDHALAEGCRDPVELAARCDAAVERVVSDRRLPGAIVLLHEDPIGASAPLSASAAPLLLERLLPRIAARGLCASKLAPRATPGALARFVQV